MDKVLKSKGHNPLLVHDDVGQAKPSTRYLPSQQHAYGKPQKKDPEGASKGKSSLLIFSHLNMDISLVKQSERN